MTEIGSERHISIDIETLGTGSDAVVASVGAAVFFPNDGYSPGASHQWNLDVPSQMAAGRVMDFSTVKWWLSQSKEAIDKTFNAPNVKPPLVFIDEFDQFCMCENGNVWTPKNVYIWGNGNMFDNAIMRSFYKSFNAKYPIDYRNDLDLRTMKWLAKNDMPTIADVGTGHNAVDDAVYQANQLTAIIERIYNK